MKRTALQTVFGLAVSMVLWQGCGPGGSARRLTVRPDYTAEQVIEAFEERYDVDSRDDLPREVVIEGRKTVFTSIARAVAMAEEGDTIMAGPGVYRESVVVTGKRVSLRGAGVTRTIILATETALYASNAKVDVTGIGLWSFSVGNDVAVVALSQSTATISDCRFSGATGPGLLVAGKSSRVTLTGNVISGNMSGGLRIQGGDIRLRRNVIVRNALAGIVLSPAVPGAISRFSMWHDTVLDNWSGRRCMSFTRGGVVPLGSLERYELEASVLNSGGLGETFSEVFYGDVKEGGNYISAAALPAPDFFVNPNEGDYRPRAPLVTDALGLEIGACPSAAGQEKLAVLLSNALVSEKLQLAYLASLFLPPARRRDAQEQIKQVLYNWTGDFLKYGRLGTRLFVALGVARVAPPDWRLNVILSRFLEGFVHKHTFAIKPLNFFAEDDVLGAGIVDYLKAKSSLFPRFITTSQESPQAFVLSGRVTLPLSTKVSRHPFEIKRSLTNPFARKVRDTLRMLESRKTEKEKKIADVEYTLNNPHFNSAAKKNSRYRKGLEKKLAKLKLEREQLDRQLGDLKKQGETVQESFDVTVEGRTIESNIDGEVFYTFVAAPSGDILLDETRPVRFVHTVVEVEPLPQYGFAGARLAGVARDPETLAINKIARSMLRAMIRKETQVLAGLLGEFKAGTIDNDAEDRLVELLLLNAPLIERALTVRDEYRELANQAPPARKLHVAVGHDYAKGADRQGVTIGIKYHDQSKVEARLEELESAYQPYWELTSMIEHFLKTRFGLNLELFFETRHVLEQLLKPPA